MWIRTQKMRIILKKGGLFPIVDVKLGRSRRLVGIGNPAPDGIY